MTQLTFGEALKDAGMLRVWSNTSEDWRAAALEAVETLARSGDPFTSEDVRAIVGDPPKPNAFGAVFSISARAGVISHHGWTKATRPGMHATDLRVWIGRTQPSRLDAMKGGDR